MKILIVLHLNYASPFFPVRVYKEKTKTNVCIIIIVLEGTTSPCKKPKKITINASQNQTHPDALLYYRGIMFTMFSILVQHSTPIVADKN